MAYLLGIGAILGGAYLAIPSPAQPAKPYIAPKPEELGDYSKGPYWTTDPAKGVPIRYAKQGVGATRFGTIPELMERTAAKLGDSPAMAYEKAGYPSDGPGEWEKISWKQYRDQSRRFARALLSIDFEPFKAVAICGFNGPYWFIAHMGVTYAVGLSAGTYTTNSADACKFVVDHSEAQVVVVDNVKTMQKYLSVEMPTVKHIVVALETVPADLKAKHGNLVMNWEDFLAKGDSVPDAKLDERMKKASVEQCATLIYTSGTTGVPKAVMASHDALQFGALAATQTALGDKLKNTPGDVNFISYLPLSHIAAQMLDIILPMYLSDLYNKSIVCHFARVDALKGSLPLTLKAVRPHYFFGVPRVWEKIVEGIKEKAKANPATGMKKKLVDFAKRVGLECSLNRQVGGSGKIPRGYSIADKLVFTKVKQALGLERSLAFLSAAAPIQRETLVFLASLGIDVTEVYGMSETTGNGTAGSAERFQFGCVGAPLDGQELILDHVEGRDKPGEGEICYRGRHVMMGYLRNAEKTKETFDEKGYLHSGDVGKFHDGMQLSITGRIKELIIGAGGENIAPVPIEDELKRLCPAISNAVMIGDKRKFNTMLVTLKSKQNLATGEFTDELVADAKEVNPDVKTVSEARKDPKWKKHIEDALKAYNSGPVCVSNAQKVQKFVILPKDLSVVGGELTESLKMKRSVIAEKYSDLIEEMYA